MILARWNGRTAAESIEEDSLDAITGVVWGSLMGGACWLVLLALVWSR